MLHHYSKSVEKPQRHHRSRRDELILESDVGVNSWLPKFRLQYNSFRQVKDTRCHQLFYGIGHSRRATARARIRNASKLQSVKCGAEGCRWPRSNSLATSCALAALETSPRNRPATRWFQVRGAHRLLSRVEGENLVLLPCLGFRLQEFRAVWALERSTKLRHVDRSGGTWYPSRLSE